MKLNKLIGLLAVAGLVAPGVASATNGYFSHGYGMKAKGMAGAATAMTGDTFGGANNPATMVWAGDRLDVGVDWFSPIRSSNRTGGSSAVNMVPPAFQPFFVGSNLDGSSDSSSNSFFVPEFGYNKMLNNDMSLGITVYGNGGMNTDYQNAPIAAGNCPTPTGPSPVANNLLCGQGKLGVNLEQLIIAPTFAYKLNQNHSIGISPLFGYQRFAADGLQAFGQISTDPNNLTNRGHDSASGWGVRVGWLGKITNSVSVGAAYSSKINMSKFDRYKGLFAEQGDFDIPENYNIGVAVKATPTVTVALDYQRINYGGVKAIANSSVDPLCYTNPSGCLGGSNGIGFGWKDVDVWKLGVEWQYSSALTLRAGYNHGDNPIKSQDATFNILAPGVVQDHLTLGGTYALSGNSELTVAYMHAFEKSISGTTNPAYFPAGGTDQIKMYQDSLGVAYGVKF
jgi:long-chain fatty acid transport protein